MCFVHILLFLSSSHVTTKARKEKCKRRKENKRKRRKENRFKKRKEKEQYKEGKRKNLRRICGRVVFLSLLLLPYPSPKKQSTEKQGFYVTLVSSLFLVFFGSLARPKRNQNKTKAKQGPKQQKQQKPPKQKRKLTPQSPQ